ncbi:MAG: hypothetical protein L3J50_12435 [Emcibacter sp.]|nr:hypothetical protein [Emcibacter sp.]
MFIVILKKLYQFVLFFVAVSLLGIMHSYAALITYEFSGIGNRIFEHNGQSGINTTVVNSSFFGFNLKNDDVFNILITYNSSALESNFRQNYPDQGTAIYSSGLINYIVNIGEVDYSFNLPGNIQIWDNRFSVGSYTDAFSISNSKFFDNDLFITSSFGMFDRTGQSQTGFLVPENLENIFDLSSNIFHFAWVDRNNGNQLHYYGTAKALSSISIPESPSPYLLGLGFFCVIFCRYKKMNRCD